MFAKTLKWPIVILLLVGGVHWLLELVLPGLQAWFTPPVVGLVLFVFGLSVGYRTIQNGGGLGPVILGAVLLGLLPIMLDVVGFGLILGRGLPQGVLGGVFGFSMILWGSLIGGGFALQARPESETLAQTQLTRAPAGAGASRAAR